ncbi:MAG: sensor histidine kinase [Lachnospiraceae bacterium]
MKNPCPGLWLADIQEQTKHLTSLSNNLITLSRMEEERTRLQMIDFPFSDVVEETVQSFQALARTQNKTFETLIQPMISLYGDEKSLTQLVSILLDNAMKYSTPESGEISLRLEKAGNNVKLSVYNTADSIDREQLPHLFDRFSTGPISPRSSRTGGYGLRLSIAAAVVNTHKGKITATTQDEHSLLITVTLPLKAQGRK